jgi:phosphoenolpyruvate-protein kinase (PTS system EI component)
VRDHDVPVTLTLYILVKYERSMKNRHGSFCALAEDIAGADTAPARSARVLAIVSTRARGSHLNIVSRQ